jgi:hypothetical protein
MEIVIIIALSLFFIAALYSLIRENKKRKLEQKNSGVEEIQASPAADCCGAHEICEYDLAKVNVSNIEYYEDEELDKYKNIDSDKYSDEQIDQFREVLFTLNTNEIRYWLLSIERREINLPEQLKDEARMLMSEM